MDLLVVVVDLLVRTDRILLRLPGTEKVTPDCCVHDGFRSFARSKSTILDSSDPQAIDTLEHSLCYSGISRVGISIQLEEKELY